MAKRKNPSAEVKAKVALEAIREERTLAGPAKTHGACAPDQYLEVGGDRE